MAAIFSSLFPLLHLHLHLRLTPPSSFTPHQLASHFRKNPSVLQLSSGLTSFLSDTSEYMAIRRYLENYTRKRMEDYQSCYAADIDRVACMFMHAHDRGGETSRTKGELHVQSTSKQSSAHHTGISAQERRRIDRLSHAFPSRTCSYGLSCTFPAVKYMDLDSVRFERACASVLAAFDSDHHHRHRLQHAPTGARFYGTNLRHQ